MNRVGVVAALASEARALRHRDGLLVSVSGIGGAAAGKAAEALIAARATALMTFGLAGGLDPKLMAGSIVVPSRLVSRDGAHFSTCAPWRERVASALRFAGAVSEGALLTSALALHSQDEKAAAYRDTGAVAVDMESVAVAEVAAQHELEFIAVRVIVDTAADALPGAVLAASRAGKVQIGRLLAGLVLAPGEIAALLRLALRYRVAMRSLMLAGARIP